ncbi:MAG: hypothetical protein JNK72_04475 [Myxococcales bacterium]|nr:hypothetical protein [Myxococcales bacterium]
MAMVWTTESINSTGLPNAFTRNAPEVACAVTHGIGGPPIVKAHPAMTIGSPNTNTGCRLRVTRSVVGIGITVPPCGHIMALAFE